MTELWRPSPQRIAEANLTRFIECVNTRRGTQLREYGELYAWSLAQPESFWSELARFADVRAEWGTGPVIAEPERMPGARFFPDARLNFAANLLMLASDCDFLAGDLLVNCRQHPFFFLVLVRGRVVALDPVLFDQLLREL